MIQICSHFDEPNQSYKMLPVILRHWSKGHNNWVKIVFLPTGNNWPNLVEQTKKLLAEIIQLLHKDKQ